MVDQAHMGSARWWSRWWSRHPIITTVAGSALVAWLGLDALVAEIPGPFDSFQHTSEQSSATEAPPVPPPAAPTTNSSPAAALTSTTPASTSTSTTEPVPSDMDPVVKFVGGCGRFAVFAQGRYDTPGFGAAVRVDPYLSAPQIGSFGPRKAISVNGWVETESPYPTNDHPWDSDVWCHLTDDSGWVSFAGVRSEVSFPDVVEGPAGGGWPVELRPECKGRLMPVGDE